MDLNYIEKLARQIADRIPTSKLPAERDMALFRMYSVLALAKGREVTSEDVHNAWAAWMCGVDPNHVSLVPFERLPRHVAAEDAPYVEAIHAVAREL